MNKLILKTTLLVGVSSFILLPSAFAEPSNQSEIKQQRSQVQSEINKVDEQITATQTELDEISAQISRVDEAIKENNLMMDETKQNIAAANAEVEKFQQEITDLEVDIENRYEFLKKRAVAFQQNGGSINYLEVIMGSKGFMDFINRVSVVTTLVEADAELLEKDQADRDSLEVKQTAVEDKLAELTDMKTELEGMQAMIVEQKQHSEQLKEELEQKKQDNLNQKADLQQEDRNLAAKAAELSRPKVTQFSASSSASPRVSSSPSTPTFSGAVGSGSLSVAINAGYKYIGNSAYKFGGGRSASDIANGLFDCSGFVHWAFAQAGINVGSSTATLSGQGQKVSVSEMKPGDLVFFNTYKTNGHVGIYIGGGQFIGSQSNSGVAIASMSSSYWRNAFNGHVRRIAN
ncbi:NlpC/P60 family protein [Radiobacillus sp. PE A8.2]|uniref:C40 family peptidase n=1 Tax=Radiobacillus sp. PE A8.2 TaxID=3380349 RepID=UPI00388ECB22